MSSNLNVAAKAGMASDTVCSRGYRQTGDVRVLASHEQPCQGLGPG